MKEITLTNGMKTQVDDCDFENLNRFTWTYHKGYAGRLVGGSKNGRRRIFLHHEILRPENGMEIDHEDRQKLNNQRGNLRQATGTQNRWNVKRAAGRSGKIGVACLRGKFVAQISIAGRTRSLGVFETLEAAVQARDAKAKEIRGEFAVVNAQ